MIQIKGLSKKYKNFLLDHASFTLPDGKIVGLIGTNGAGKSTLIRIMVGLEEKTDGEILVDGVPVTNVGEALRVGFISQNLEIYVEQKMSEIVELVKASYKELWNDELYNHYFRDVFKLKDDMKIKELSTGMRVKFFLAIELAKEPECLLLDEATSGLDPMTRDELIDILMKLAEEKNIPILLSSHITEDLEKIGDYITYIDCGQILLEDTVRNIRNRFYKVDPQTVEILSDVEKQKLMDDALKMHQYYIYDKNCLTGEKNCGTPALLSEVLAYLRKGE